MERIKFLIKNPYEVKGEDIFSLQKEIEKRPYFYSLRMLLLYGLKQANHPSFDEELKKTSIYAPNRTALFHYLNDELDFENPEIKSKKSIQSAEESQEKTEITHAEKPQEEKEIEVVKPSFFTQSYTFNEWINLGVSKKPKEKSANERDIKFQLIDEFLEKSPRIVPSKNFDEIPEPEIKPNKYSDIISETLAEMYAKQHKYDKAIEAFKVLSLKYPEKSSFFANRISNLESLKNSK